MVGVSKHLNHLVLLIHVPKSLKYFAKFCPKLLILCTGANISTDSQ